jgi:hypothetical protein
MFLPGLLGFLRKLFITTTFALPQWKDGIRIRFALVNCATRRDDFATAHRTDAAARRAPLNIDLKLLGYVSHGYLPARLRRQF